MQQFQVRSAVEGFLVPRTVIFGAEEIKFESSKKTTNENWNHSKLCEGKIIDQVTLKNKK